jgi:diaminohydroxyphosphoribosylaminopyrimidine deaminase / 5-amino-6-(5-phosphoribosylamino)uracil reductase
VFTVLCLAVLAPRRIRFPGGLLFGGVLGLSEYMALALELAQQATGRTSPNPLVGAVIVKDGKVVGQGYHQQAGTPHAEVHALKEAGDRAKGSTIYVTLEPCSHYGRTPPCAKALIEAGVSKVVSAMEDPFPLVAGRGFKMLREAGIEVQVGDLEHEARRVNEVFIKHVTTGLPFVVYKTAMSLDGKISTTKGESQWITGEDTRAWVHKLRDRYDGIMVGINTVLEDNPSLNCRIPGGKDPHRLLVDSKLSLPLSAKLISSSPSAPLIVATTSNASEQKVKALEDLGVQVLVYSGTQVPLHEFLQDLGKRNITGILLEGGATLAWSMFEAGLVDKTHFCVAPKLLGGNSAPGPLGGKGVECLSEAISLCDLQVEQIGQDFVFTGYTKSSQHKLRLTPQ